MNTPTPRTDDVYLEHRYWANEDEATEAIEDLRDLARKLERELATERAKVRTLHSALQNLADEQNGAPLERRREEWQEAMDEACAVLAATEEAK